MRDSAKVVIVLGSIWGLFVFGSVVFAAVFLPSNVTVPEVIAVLLNGLTLLPSCILAIWFPRKAAAWLIFLTGLSLFGLVYAAMVQGLVRAPLVTVLESLAWPIVLAFIPALLGVLLLRTAPKSKNSRTA